MNQSTEHFLIRGRVITNFAFLEAAISDFIAHHYFQNSNLKEAFLSEVMEEQYFNFDLKRRLFIKILEKYPEFRNKMKLKQFQSMQEIRNILAHGTYEKNENGERCFRRGGINYLADDLLNEYQQLRKVVQPLMEELPGVSKCEWSEESR